MSFLCYGFLVLNWVDGDFLFVFVVLVFEYFVGVGASSWSFGWISRFGILSLTLSLVFWLLCVF